MHDSLINPPPKIQTMTGKEEFMSIPEGRNMLRVRQSSDMSPFHCCKEESAQKEREELRGLTPGGCKQGRPKLLASNDERGEREYLGWGGEKRRLATGGSAKGIPVRARDEEGVHCTHACIREESITSEEVQVRRLKMPPYDGCTSELHAGLLAINPRLQDCEDERVQLGDPHGCPGQNDNPHDCPGPGQDRRAGHRRASI